MTLTYLINGLSMGWKYPENAGQHYFLDQIRQEKAPKFERVGFYTAIIAEHPLAYAKALYRESKSLRNFITK